MPHHHHACMRSSMSRLLLCLRRVLELLKTPFAEHPAAADASAATVHVMAAAAPAGPAPEEATAVQPAATSAPVAASGMSCKLPAYFAGKPPAWAKDLVLT